MARTTTTLAAACAADDTQIKVTSATGFAAGNRIIIDGEEFTIINSYVSGTTIPTLRGQAGTVVSAHASGANVTTGLSTDFASPGPQQVVTYPTAGRVRTITSYSATGAITLPTAGADAVAVLNGTTGLTMTVAAPTKDMDGSFLYVASNGAATTTTIAFAGGLNGAGLSYDVLTLNTSAPVLIGVMALNGNWMVPVSPAMGGTVTNLIGTIG